MFFKEKTKKFFVILTLLVTIATLYPARETKAFSLCNFFGIDCVAEVGPNLAIQIAIKAYEVILKPLAISIAKAAIRTVVADLKNQTIRWIVTGQFGKPQFVTSFQADPRKIAENASRIFLSRLANINFCQFNQNIPSSNLLFSAKLNVQLECTVPGGSGPNGKIETDWFRAGFPTLWAITHPQNNGWDVAARVITQKNISEQNSLNAFYNEILTNNGVRGFKGKNGEDVTPGFFVAEALKTTIQKDYPTINDIDEFSGILQAITEIVDAGLKKSIQTGLTTAFK